MKLSHILYKVKDLHKAVKDFEDLGFTVVYGTKPSKAFNALIWFEQGPFIELFQVGQNKLVLNLMKLIGKKGLANRFALFQNAGYGWVDCSIENDSDNLKEENLLLKQMGYKFSTMPGFRTDINNIRLKWKLTMPYDIEFPFLMSTYSPNPRPENIKHKNGATGVEQLVWGTNKQNIKNISKLTDDKRLCLVEGSGFNKIVIGNFDNTILNQPYYE
jgi:hypothetical protein